MHLNKTGILLLTVLALGAILASSAQAEGLESEGTWHISGSGGPGAGETINVSGGPWALHSSLLGVTFSVTAESIECASNVTACTIENESRGGVSHAMSMGALRFTNITVDIEGEASPCGVPGNAITSKPLRDEIVMHGGGMYDKFYPVSGAVLTEFEFSGETCPLAGIVIVVKGVTYGEAEHATGVLASDQTFSFQASEQETLGSTLHIGKATPAVLTGTAHNTLSGANKGSIDVSVGEVGR